MNPHPVRIRQNLLRAFGLMLLMCGGSNPVAAQEEASPTTDVPSIESLESLRKQAAENTALDESVRAKLDEFYERAIGRTKEAAASRLRTQQLAEELSNVAASITQEQERLDSVVPTMLQPLSENDSADEVTKRLTEARTLASGRQEQLQTILAEIEHRSTRRAQLPALRQETVQRLEALEKESAAPPAAEESPDYATARQTAFVARRNAVQAELALIDQELLTYESTSRLWLLRRDVAERDQKDAERVVASLQDHLAQIRQQEARLATEEARRTAANAHPAVREAATRNAALAEENQKTLAALERTRQQIGDATALRDSLKSEFESLQKRAEAAGFSQAIGLLLRNQRSRLPDTGPYIRRSHEREREIAAVNLQLIEWETERSQLVDTEDPVEQIQAALPDTLSEYERADIGAELRKVFSQQRQLLSDTIENGNQQLDRLVTLDSVEKSIVTATDSQSEYIAEHVLWVKSAEPFSTAILEDVGNFGPKLLSRSSWTQTQRVLASDIRERWLTWLAFALTVLWLILTRSRIRRSLRESGELASRTTTTVIRPTIRAVFDSLILAVPGPLIMWFIGQRVTAVNIDIFTRSFGVSLQETAALWCGIEVIRQLIRKGGVCDKHFNWPDRSLTAVRRWLGTGVLICVPSVWILRFSELQDDEILQNSIGRIAFILCATVVCIGLFQLVRSGGPISRDIALHGGGGILKGRARPFAALLIVLAPPGLATASLIGFHFSALQLAQRLVVSAVLVVGLILLHAFLRRWLLVNYRRLAIARARQKREANLRETNESTEERASAESPEVVSIPEVSLTDVNLQTHRLIRLGAFLCAAIGLWVIWIDVLPALGILRNFKLWPSQIATSGQPISGETTPFVTLADLVLAILFALLTIVAARNIPGLLEISLLQHLPMDAGARYAASSLTRYFIAVIGVTLSFWMIGIGWSSVQWLIAAMTVGLGFGLQEIFANFVSGLILLFERPIRVGDTVTVKEITGTISRIRIRATTILDWDNRELIVPNRAFVTDNLINWTLSNPNLRMVLKVGVAYGSDTLRTTELLYEVARNNNLVLAEPEPQVIFDSFGDSTLNFELRLFVAGVASYRRLRHELNIAIDDAFRAARIEIAYPQRDLHIRSVPPGVLPDTARD